YGVLQRRDRGARRRPARGGARRAQRGGQVARPRAPLSRTVQPRSGLTARGPGRHDPPGRDAGRCHRPPAAGPPAAAVIGARQVEPRAGGAAPAPPAPTSERWGRRRDAAAHGQPGLAPAEAAGAPAQGPDAEPGRADPQLDGAPGARDARGAAAPDAEQLGRSEGLVRPLLYLLALGALQGESPQLDVSVDEDRVSV